MAKSQAGRKSSSKAGRSRQSMSAIGSKGGKRSAAARRSTAKRSANAHKP